jgi:hypothetical protein
MELINATRMVAGYTMGMEPSGRELLVVVVKGTFTLPKSGEDVRLHEEQVPLVMADTFTGEPGFSAPMYEVDFAPRKPRCDILLLGSAYAPGGRPTQRVPVGLRIGNWKKTFMVVGKRHWETGLGGIHATAPEPFTVQPFSYDVAFGGVDDHHEDASKHAAFMRNPIGGGFHKHLRGEWVDGSPLPNTEEINRPVDKPDGEYEPMAFAPVGRGWEQRSCYAGTYDDKWLEDHFPFLPPDFDEQYYQAAPLDQQLPFAVGGQEVSLGNLTSDGMCTFMLPAFEAPINIFSKKGEREDYRATLDTIVFEPDCERFTMTWRIARPLKKNMFEVAQVLVGRKGKEWWQQRDEIAFPIPVVMVPMQREPEESSSA